METALQEEPYVRLPSDLQMEGCSYVQLCQAVYGLKQAGTEWYEATYAGQDLAVFHLVMGIGVPWGEKAAYLSQKEYISQMVEAYGLDDAEPASLPMTPGLTLEPASEGTDSSIPDRALCAQLQRVATCARSDIMAVVSVLSRFRTTYGPAHFTPLKQALRYLKGTDDYELVMRASPVLAGEEDAATATLPLRIYTDVDYAEWKYDGDHPPSPSPTPAVPPTQESLLQQILDIHKQQAEGNRLLRQQLQRQTEISAELEAKIAAKSGSSDSEAAAKSAEQLLERRRRLEYVPEAPVNPFPARPATLTTRIPQLYDLHGNKAYDSLSKKSTMKYECLGSNRWWSEKQRVVFRKATSGDQGSNEVVREAMSGGQGSNESW
eukprot:gene1408-biopygen1267